MRETTAEVVICGAGIAGISAAYHLAVRRGVAGVVLVDERPPMSLTSDKSTECYRNWWPGPGEAMVALMNRSIDLLEELARESGNVFGMNRRGYLFATADPARAPQFIRRAEEAQALGAGPARLHDSPGSDYRPAPPDGFEGEPTGADVITDAALIRRHFPYLTEETVAVLHARRCGWLSGQQLGMYMLERAREKGVRLIDGRVEGIDTTGGRLRSVTVAERGGRRTISTGRFVNAAGPFLKHVGWLLGVDLPVFCERHAKVAFNDTLGAVPRHAPMLLWADPVRLPWSEDERGEWARSEAHRYLLGEFEAGVHGRPEGAGDSPVVLLIWTYDVAPVEPTFPIAFDPAYPEIAIRGMSRMIPALGAYLPRLPRTVVDGGYYTKTRENRFLACPLPVEGAWVLGALSGYGLMAAAGAADLLADHITGRPLPRYAPAFSLERYDDPAYRALLDSWGDSGQL
ncbi:MAG: FAD-dependent oxidoreductase [Candidatus Rokubacteria bacterium GWC2_70_16]|nr:MAG: FAD-dependent oxidoreductase [Candidatus Rokubacteria bacterium GWC2_70_16]OGL17455.1 MAG: FAD-dependent oxidoreductase [Candidatus Rokubacteria bacterium RIFCSPLOWO2_12_FULL_71_19]